MNNGFHAPALAAQDYKNTANANTSINHTLQVSSPQARALGASHYGSITRSGTPATGSEIFYDVGDLWVTDLSVDFSATERVRFRLGGNNIFDVKSTKLPQALLAARQSYAYANNGPISDTGGWYSLAVSYSF